MLKKCNKLAIQQAYKVYQKLKFDNQLKEIAEFSANTKTQQNIIFHLQISLLLIQLKTYTPLNDQQFIP